MSDDTSPLRQTVPVEMGGQRLDQALARMFPEFSRSRLKDWILKGRVVVDGETLRPRDKVEGGESVEVTPLTGEELDRCTGMSKMDSDSAPNPLRRLPPPVR